jgi:uncharacterized protein (TIGR02301 family)
MFLNRRLPSFIACVRVLSVGICVSLGSAIALAAPASSPASSSASSSPPVPTEVPTPLYEKDLLRLAHLMGALAYLQTLCGDADAPQWAMRMQALLDAETPQPSGRRNRLAGAYNQGVQDLTPIYRTCTASAKTLSAKHADEGAALTRSLERKYSQ